MPGIWAQAQALDTIVDAARLLADRPEIRFFVVGSGSRETYLRDQGKSGMLPNITLCGRFDSKDMDTILGAAGCLLVSLVDAPIFALTVPSKLQAYLAAGRPIIASMNGEGARLVDEAGAGVAAPAEDAAALAAAIVKLAGLTDAERNAMGVRGRAYFDQHFSAMKAHQYAGRAFRTVDPRSGFQKMKILILGASGMLGHAMLHMLSRATDHTVFGTIRSDGARRFFQDYHQKRLISGVDAEDQDALVRVFSSVRPEVVVNCIGLVKQLAHADDPLVAFPVNALLPHRLARLAALANARFIHVSTDCVFSGRKGLYSEADEPDAQDVYGRSKLFGEVDYPNAITLRTSIVGRELNSSHGLVEWFLSQSGSVRGYTNAIFSGLPTCELSRVVRDHVLNHPDLHGVYHVAAAPIAKFALLDASQPTV
ncbi:sugar nucleotide-binding protein [Devosia algicola]|uniref:dTDP-4-dehydrorhamnose reductase n=1 Tax=Devosia algicola TaxID=3026418 RepID=A0ABY7YM33_9HYPH|nr:sugar nucleotide-binding protein [Devosia algicola]WDR02354.1 sugar nucleotide-binding protein [Devosia algicola]